MLTEKDIDLQQLARDVAGSLGDGWSVREPNGEDSRDYRVHAWLTQGTGNGHPHELCLSLDGPSYAPARLHADGKYPPDFDGSYIACDVSRRCKVDIPHITVAIERGAATIAREIERRLLPDYRRLHVECVKLATERREEHQRRERNLAELANAAGVEPASAERRGGSWTLNLYGIGGQDEVYGNAEPGYGESGGGARVELRSLSHEQACAVLRLLRDWPASEASHE